jgi:hypothetical protein
VFYNISGSRLKDKIICQISIQKEEIRLNGRNRAVCMAVILEKYMAITNIAALDAITPMPAFMKRPLTVNVSIHPSLAPNQEQLSC